MGLTDHDHPILLYALCFLIPYALFNLYRHITLHPLRRYPGPLLAKVTDLYALRYALSTDLHRQTYLDHLKYGSVVRHGPNKLVFNSVQALHDIHHANRLTKSRVYLASVQGPNTLNLFNAIDPEFHRTRRQLVAPVVNDKSMRIFEPTMIEQVDIFIEKLRPSSQGSESQYVDMTARCKYLGMDIVGLLAFGYNLKLQTDDPNRFIIETLRISNYFLNLQMQQPIMRHFKFDLLLYARSILKGKSYLATIAKMIEQRMSQPDDGQHDFYAFVANEMKTSRTGKVWGSEIWAEAIFFLSAGGDTISTALSALFFYLSRSTQSYQRLAAEIRSSFATGDEIKGSQLANCRYLRACIDETLRMSPPLPGTLWREEMSKGHDNTQALVIDGHAVPPGTQVGVNLYALHHNEQYFTDPFKFYPERWLPECSNMANRKAFAPFLVGPRSCAGKVMAYLEASLVIAKTLWYFDFEVAPGKLGDIGSSKPPGTRHITAESQEYRLQDIVVSSHQGPYLQFHLRTKY
ncbi:cytochrome P450 [Nemania sp. FL0916]|nr:cytochrome P450 [Nemania sp. FL0916]